MKNKFTEKQMWAYVREFTEFVTIRKYEGISVVACSPAYGVHAVTVRGPAAEITLFCPPSAMINVVVLVSN